MKILRIIRFKKRLNEKKQQKIIDQEYRIIKTRAIKKDSNFFKEINYDINPFIYVARATKEIKHIDDISINIESLYEQHYELKYVLKNPYLKYKDKKGIVSDLIARWEYDYYLDVDEQLTITLERASYNPIKRVKKIKNLSINYFIIITLLFLIFLRQFSALQLTPFIGDFFRQMNTLLIYERFYTLSVILVYLSIIIAMYLIIVKVYFDRVLKFGMSAKGFLIKERDRMLKKLKPNKKRIKKHLLVLAKNKKEVPPYPINNIYNSKMVVRRIKRYGQMVIYRVGIFTSYYNPIILFSKLLILVHVMILLYLSYSFIVVNHLI